MAKANFYMIYIERIPTVSFEQVKSKMDLANDWYRLREDLWIVYSTSDPEKWYKRLSLLVKDDGHVFICKLNHTERQGWMANSFWKWLRREGN